jgi:hypothetical protein
MGKDVAMEIISRATRLGLAVLTAAAIAAPAVAQTPSYDGDWAGVLNAGGQKLRLELHLKTVNGQATAILDSLDQDASLPATAVKADGGELSILFLSAGGELKAKLSPDGKALVGSWTQGATAPLTLTKK